MSSLRLARILVVSLSLLACEDGGGGEEGNAGELGQPCIGGSYCNEGLVCSAGVCMGGDDEAEAEGDGDSSESAGDSGESDDETADTSSSDTGSPVFGLYDGPCANTDQCSGDLWCANSQDRWWCTMDCTSEADCSAHPDATALPRCEFLDDADGVQSRQGCVLECEMESECLDGAQCFYSGLASKDWCGFLH